MADTGRFLQSVFSFGISESQRSAVEEAKVQAAKDQEKLRQQIAAAAAEATEGENKAVAGASRKRQLARGFRSTILSQLTKSATPGGATQETVGS